LKEAGQSLHSLRSILLTSSELRNILADSIHLFKDLFADAADGVADATIAATRASKKTARTVRPSEEQKKAHDTPLSSLNEEHWEDVVGNVQDNRKQIKRGAEDKREDLLRHGVKKGRAVRSLSPSLSLSSVLTSLPLAV
jgi:gas vesicle protein